MAQGRIFNSKKRRVLRKQISCLETLSGIFLLCLLSGATVWFIGQQNEYNPEERDISLDQLLQKTNSPQLFPPPLKIWQEPGTLAAGSPPEKPGVFPASVIDGEWSISSRLKEFTKENLYEKINGEAEKFIKQGFQVLSYLGLQSNRDNSEIAIELYDQGDMGGSMGIFSDHLSEDKIIEQAGPVIYFSTPAGAIGRKGRFFFRIAGNQSSEKIRKKALQLLTSFSSLEEKEDDTPKEFRFLHDSMNIPLPLISFQKQNVFQYDFARDFWFGRLNSEQNTRLFIHQEATSDESRKLFDILLEELQYDFQIQEEGETHAVLFHEYLKNYFVISRQGPYIFGIENAANPEQIASIMKKLVNKFEDG
ncbi:MAG: hypothetical protein HQM13_05080 [SAR324 cluster bacterium]|nr:hypothetical protein [SAR324 cluster bacterium]